MEEATDNHSCCCMKYLLWTFVASFVIVATLWQTKFKYHVKMVLYLFCFIIGGSIGGIISLPFGKTPSNHLNMNKYVPNDKPCVLIANHQSCIDVLTMTHCWPENCVVMLKSSLKFLPGFNLCAYVCNSIYINRFSKEKAHATVDNTIHEILSNKRKVFIYPEGTRNSNDAMLPFKKGAFKIAKEAKIPIVCCVFSQYKNFYSYEERRFDDSGDIICEFLPPVDSNAFDDIDDLSNHCYRLMQDARERVDKEIATSFSKKKTQ